MKNIKVKCPAKINLTLEVLNKREDGFHNIKSIMQMISLCDILHISVYENKTYEIILSGNSREIPYDNKNLVHKAAALFFEKSGIKNIKTEVYIEKRIPVAAGLAGGSTDAAGMLYGLNKIFDNLFSRQELHELCAVLGSDLNVCLEGGCILAASRGEVISKVKGVESPVTIIKPKNIGISAREAYTKYSMKGARQNLNMTEKMLEGFKNGKNFSKYLYNDLEYAVFDDYKELQLIKSICPDAIMSGSGSAYFVLRDLDVIPDENLYETIRGLKFVKYGVTLI